MYTILINIDGFHHYKSYIAMHEALINTLISGMYRIELNFYFNELEKRQ